MQRAQGFLAIATGNSGTNFVTCNMFHSRSDKLTPAEGAEVNAQMSSEAKCMCRQLQSCVADSLKVQQCFMS